MKPCINECWKKALVKRAKIPFAGTPGARYRQHALMNDARQRAFINQVPREHVNGIINIHRRATLSRPLIRFNRRKGEVAATIGTISTKGDLSFDVISVRFD